MYSLISNAASSEPYVSGSSPNQGSNVHLHWDFENTLLDLTNPSEEEA